MKFFFGVKNWSVFSLNIDLKKKKWGQKQICIFTKYKSENFAMLMYIMLWALGPVTLLV